LGRYFPDVRSSLTGNDGTTTYTLWEGFLERIEPVVSTREAQFGRNMTCDRSAWIFEPLRSIATEMKTNIKTGAAVTEVLDEAGWPDDDRDIDTGNRDHATFLGRSENDFRGTYEPIEDTEIRGHRRDRQHGNISIPGPPRQVGGYTVHDVTGDL
jgi:hypothetical protein